MSSSEINFQELWDNSAQTYSKFDESYYPARLKLELLKNYSKRSFQCLDIGIANGIYSIPLSRFVQSVDGVDISEQMLKKCKSEINRLGIPNIILHNQSAEELPFENEKFDLVFSFATLGLIPNLENTFREMERVLKHGGYAILDIIGKNNLSRIYWERYYKSIGHFGLNSFSLPVFQKQMQDIGFNIIENHSIGILDQWKYIPGINKIKWFERVAHAKNAIPDFDYYCSQLLPMFANHWFVAIKKK